VSPRWLRECRLEQVFLDEADTVLHTRLGCVLIRLFDPFRIQVVPDAARPVLERCVDHDAAVAATQVDQDIAGATSASCSIALTTSGASAHTDIETSP